MKVQEIRKRFTEYFIKHGHEKIASSPLVPQNDPTLLFANAGMNQFKDNFTGKANPANRRATTIQKCVRAGGKHNDLENVGFTARHHTFFEMLGNFSFGDYFKEEAIDFAWKLLTEEFKIPKDKLYVTVHYTDDEAVKIWNEQQGVPLDRIFKKGDKDNFWEMGEYGPCGPCTEIFYDHGEEHSIPGFVPGEGQDLLDDEGRYVEIWNLVFMQFEKTPEGQFPLPKPSVDTGAGLERIAAVLQGKYWNYDTDVFEPILSKIEELSGKKYTDEKYTSPMRVVADHIRSCTMLITDGVIPSNEGRGYVLRRIIRRAVRNLREMGIKEVSFYKLIPAVMETLGEEYPQNVPNESLAVKLLQLEEKKFLETLDTGLKFLNESMKKDLKDGVLPGAIAFKLYDTYGFPFDLTEVILKEKDLEVDVAGFEEAMKKQKEASKKSWKGGAVNDEDIKKFYADKEKHGATEFLGYETLTNSAKLLSKHEVGELTALVFDKTPFYGESGGQAGDIGMINSDGNKLADIFDTQKPVEDLHVHYSKNADSLEVGETYELSVDKKNRNLSMRHHSATHLLQAALIEVLGDHVKQAGSLVNSDKLRFDFTHPQAMTKEEVKRVEEIVNEQIRLALPVNPEVMTKDQALEKGAMALFGEKYGDEVRVVEMGNFSLEFCGGTHVSNTSEIELFSVLLETSLSSGVRRMEAVVSEVAIERLYNRSNILDGIEQELSLKGEEAFEQVKVLKQQLKDMRKERDQLKDQLQEAKSADLLNNPVAIGDYKFICAQAPEGADLRKFSDAFISKNENGILVLSTRRGDKFGVLVRAHKSNKAIHCGNILKDALKELDGRGGGKPDMAQGSVGSDAEVSKFNEIAQRLITEALS